LLSRNVQTNATGFGVKSDALRADYDLNSFGAKEVGALSGSTTAGFQMLNTFKRKLNPQGGLLLADALNRGVDLGVHFIEVYAVDRNEPCNAQVLTEAAGKLKKIIQHANASSETRTVDRDVTWLFPTMGNPQSQC
jgi:hypothetical protein